MLQQNEEPRFKAHGQGRQGHGKGVDKGKGEQEGEGDTCNNVSTKTF